MSLIQWNCRGLLHNYDDVCSLLEEYRPLAVCLQETHLKGSQSGVFRHFHFFRKDRDHSSYSSGGVAIVVQKSAACVEVSVQTALEAVAVRILSDRLITLCSLYIPPNFHLRCEDLESLIAQLPHPFIILGDFNAHNPLWGSTRRDTRGAIVERFILSTNLCLFNEKKPTNSFTSIDLSISEPILFSLFSWQVTDNPLGSDHMPIVLRRNNPGVTLPSRTPRWKFEKANWSQFSEFSLLACTSLDKLSMDEVNEYLTNCILQAAIMAIPMTSGRLPRRPKPWWNEECSESRKKQNKAWSIFRRYPTSSNHLHFKQMKARARYIRRQSKRTSFQGYATSINSHTSPKEVWDRINKINGCYTAFTIPLLSCNGTCPESLEEQADILGEHFEFVSSSRHYSPSFLRLKQREEARTIKAPGSAREPYNRFFTLIELKMVLHNVKPSATGPDGIHYFMLNHLHPSTLDLVLYLFNRIWEEGRFPSAWRTATIIPLLKPGKNSDAATSYRPIALTSCLCKTLEKMINRRLMQHLEKHCILDKYQCGFRSFRSTQDQLVRLETTVREAFVNRQYCLSVFFDLEKACDTAWRHGILRDLIDIGIQGRMFFAIESYLGRRTFRVRLGSVHSRWFVQENGIPQGGVLSATLFAIKINSIARVIPPSVHYSLYVDDLQIAVSSCNLAICERRVQLTINNVTRWADNNGFKFSTEKTACVCFSRKLGVMPTPSLTIYSAPVQIKTEYKFLGLIFDSKLSFSQHIKTLKQKCHKSLNILRVLSHMTWGSDRLCLLRIYRSIVRSRLDYGCLVYGSASASTLKMLDPIHHAGIRLATGAFRTSPVLSLYAEANEMSLEKRRDVLGLMYSLRIRSVVQHPCRELVEGTRFERTFQSKPAVKPPFSLRNKTAAASANLQTNPPVAQLLGTVAPWEHGLLITDLSLTEYTKKNTPPEVLKQEFFELQNTYKDYTSFYTDGTKTDSCVGCSVIGPSLKCVRRINSSATILTAELYGLLLATDYIIKNRHTYSVVYTDSLSALRALRSLEIAKNPIITQLQHKVVAAARDNKLQIVFCWVPSHAGIPGNEAADRAASTCATRKVDLDDIPYQDYKATVKKSIKCKWQEEWSRETNNKLHVVKPMLQEWASARHRDRFFEVILCRLRIGHTHLTHGYLLRREDPPACEHCSKPLTVVHILLECPAYHRYRQFYFAQFYSAQMPLHLALLLGDEPFINHTNVFKFLESTGLLHRL